MKSMTGYGRAKQELHGRTITAELRAVNHRYLDCTVKAPRQYGFLDDAVKKAAAARIARGKVEVYIGVETQEGGDIAVTVNHAVAEHYLAALHELADKYGLRDDVSVMSLAKLPDVLGSERIEQDADEMTRDVLSVFGEACDNFDEMRTREGAKLAEDVRNRASEIERMVGEVEVRSPERVREYREKLLDAVSMFDDEIMEMYLEGEEIPTDKIRAAIRRATVAVEMVPVVCGSSYRNKGVQKLLDAVVDYMPAPTDIPAIKGVNPKTDEEEDRKPSDDEPFSALAFKIMTDPYVGRLSFFRVYSGHLTTGSSVLNSVKNQKERMGRILQMHANHREDIEEIEAGELRVWTAGGRLFIRTPEAERAYIVTFDGRVYKTLSLPAGEYSERMPQGSYIIHIGKQSYKLNF